MENNNQKSGNKGIQLVVILVVVILIVVVLADIFTSRVDLNKLFTKNVNYTGD